MTGGESGDGRIVEMNTSATSLDRLGGRVCKTKYLIANDDKSKEYKGVRNCKLYNCKISDGEVSEHEWCDESPEKLY